MRRGVLLCAYLLAAGCGTDDARPFGGGATLGAGQSGGSTGGSDAGIAIRGGSDAQTGGTGGGVLNVTTGNGPGGVGGSGGQTPTGGNVGTGGIGAAGTGGAIFSASGGAAETGGRPAGTGGVTMGTGGARTGGAPGGGGSGTGGRPGTGGAHTGGMTGTGGTVVSTGGAAGGGNETTAECRQFILDYEAEMQSARACASGDASPAAGGGMPGGGGRAMACDMLVTAKLAGCGSNCSTYVADSAGLDVIRKRWTKAGCVDPACAQPVTCTTPKSSTCTASTGMCTDVR